MKKYFTTYKGDNWRFHCITKDKNGSKKSLYLKNISDIKIRRHIKIKSEATPFNPTYKEYFRNRDEKQKRCTTNSNYNDSAGFKII